MSDAEKRSICADLEPAVVAREGRALLGSMTRSAIPSAPAPVARTVVGG